MTRLLTDCGEALYGPRWQTDLSRDLGIADRTMRRWVATNTDLPDLIYLELLRLTEHRAAVLTALAQRLRDVVPNLPQSRPR